MAAAAIPQVSPVSKPSLWVGRILMALIALFLLMDGLMKVVQERHVVAASAELGFQPSTMIAIGWLLIACTVLYLIPRTSVLGALLLTGYLGGAVCTNVRVQHPIFECIFPVLMGAIVWGSLYLREPRLRGLVSFDRG